MKLGIAEILKKAGELSIKKERIEWLRKNDSAALRLILKYAYDERIKFLLPEGKPPYKVNDLPDQQGILYGELRRFYLFVEGGHPTLKQVKREFLFIQLLEMLDAEDAELVCAVKDKKIPYKFITKNFVQEVYPGLLEA